MIFAEKGNRVHRINEADIQTYVEQGYTITDGMGHVIKETVPTDVPTLRLEFTKKEAEIKQLEAKITELSAEIITLKGELDTIKAENEELKSKATSASETKPSRGRKKEVKTEDTDTEA